MINKLIGITAAALLTISVQALPLEDASEAIQNGDYETAVKLLRTAAEAGDAAAQSSLGELYDSGLGVQQDFAEAVSWLSQAANQNHAAAQNGLGRHYAEGRGIQQDFQLARHWLLAAAQQGEAQHQYDLALLLENAPDEHQDLPQAVVWYQRAADQDLVAAQANLGLLYYQGGAVEQDFDRAFELFSNAAEQGHARAQNNLGLMYTRGEGQDQDYEKAVQWYRLAAEQDLPQALTNLGVMYENGYGVPFDEEEAVRLYRAAGQAGGYSLASLLDQAAALYDPRITSIDPSESNLVVLLQQANLGDPVARYILAHQISNTESAQRDYPRAAQLYETAARAGLTYAMLHLGVLYIKGLGVPQDYTLGYMWISSAAAAGQPEAMQIRDLLFPQLTAEQVNKAQELARQR